MENIVLMLLTVDVEKDNYQLKLEDGSKWYVNPGDLPTIATWIPTANIEVENLDDDSMFSYVLTNLNIAVSVRAMKIKKSAKG